MLGKFAMIQLEGRMENEHCKCLNANVRKAQGMEWVPLDLDAESIRDDWRFRAFLRILGPQIRGF
jgi:hypothetical protein